MTRDFKYKCHQKGLQKKSLKRRRHYKKWKKHWNSQKYLKEYIRANITNRAKHKAMNALIIAPKDFYINSDPDAFLSFINKVKYFKRWKSLFVDMRNSVRMGSGAIGMFLSVVESLRERGIAVYGNKPIDRNAKTKFESSGFFDHVKGEIEDSSKRQMGKMKKREEDTVDPVASAEIVSFTMSKVWGIDGRNQKLQSMLIELMANTVNHAFTEDTDKTEKKWILAVDFDSEENKAMFSFVDNGRGIIKTLRLNVLQKFYSIFFDDSDLLKTAFQGDIGSRTGLKYRGRGLPAIFNKYKSNFISNLIVITNKVFLNFEEDRKIMLDNEFIGTYYYWEVSLKNKRDESD